MFLKYSVLSWRCQGKKKQVGKFTIEIHDGKNSNLEHLTLTNISFSLNQHSTMNRGLICGPKDYDKHQLVKTLFNLPNHENIEQRDNILNDLEIHTKYYDSQITVFIDEPEANTVQSFIDWITEFMSDEMKELRDELQYILFIAEDGGELDAIVGDLNDLLDKEYCAAHPDALQWDGELIVVAKDEIDIAECISLLHCVVWRHLHMKEPEEVEFEFDKEVALLKNARSSHKGPVLSLHERGLVDRIVDKLCTDSAVASEDTQQTED